MTNYFNYITLIISLLLSIFIISLLCSNVKIINKTDEIIFKVGLIFQFILYLGFINNNEDYIYYTHVFLIIYTIVAPFIVTSFIGKIIYTFITISQQSIYFLNGDKCPFSYFNKEKPRQIISGIDSNAIRLRGLLLLMYIWLK
jgi:hypothetical protein